MPAEVVTPNGGTATPVHRDTHRCVWETSGLAVTIGGHYAIERILEFDRSKGCRLTLDVSAALATLHALVYRIDPVTDEPASSDTSTSVRELCPIARHVASKPLDHIDDQKPGWWERGTHPTG